MPIWAKGPVSVARVASGVSRKLATSPTRNMPTVANSREPSSSGAIRSAIQRSTPAAVAAVPMHMQPVTKKITPKFSLPSFSWSIRSMPGRKQAPPMSSRQ